ncbi:hypothetical protein HYH02_001650 [Chlamydomonas schloesseri]|uniref:Uncharacterized protein n=1 Tax=Chlamydomonas schloesseri TaxID=2026947 RepID=A0A836BBB4_9CHLO|nr:hypothetical protein HYH02_001650 [Chlamydomonas schloesseri]|eukprot:KAG2453427.1 hypothetical protein HYH02_001650 [Chlamydomonas schloesseri]
MPFFLTVSALQYCRLAWPLGMALLAGVVFLVCMSCIARFLQGWEAACSVLSSPFLLLFVLVAQPYYMRQRQRSQLHLDLTRLATAAEDHDLAMTTTLSACSLKDRWRYRAALLRGMRVTGHCRNGWDAFTYTCSLMEWYELAVPVLLAAWVLVSLTPEVLSGGVGWPFVDVAAWWWMQADFAWRLKWTLAKQLFGVAVCAFLVFPVFMAWINAFADIRARARARKARAAAGGGEEWMPPRPAHLNLYANDSNDGAMEKDRRYMKLFMALMAPPTIWERIGLPPPTLNQLACLLAVVWGGLAYGGLADLLAAPGGGLHMALAAPRLALRYWRVHLWRCEPGTLGLTVIAAVVALGVAAARASSDRKHWMNTYLDALAREMILSGAVRPTRAAENVAISFANAAHGDCPSTLTRLLTWGFQLLRLYVAMWGGSLLVGWLLFGGNLPAYALPSYRGYTGYAVPGLVRPPPPVCLALLNVSGSGAAHATPGAGSRGAEGALPAEAVLDGVSYSLTPQLVAAVREVAGQGGGMGGWWRRLQLASRVNRAAVRAYRSQGLDGVQTVMEALRAAWELSPFVMSGQTTQKYAQPEPGPVCEARAVLERALTVAWHCAAAGIALDEATAVAAPGSPTSQATGSNQRRAATGSAKVKSAGSAKRKAAAPATSGSSIGGWLAFAVALIVVYCWAYVWPPWTRSPELFLDHMAGLITRGGRGGRTATRKSGKPASPAGGSSSRGAGCGGRKEDTTPVAAASKAQRQPQSQKQAHKQTQQQRTPNDAATSAASAAPSSGHTRTTSTTSPPAEPVDAERSASSSPAHSAAATGTTPASLTRSQSTSSKQGGKGKAKAQQVAVPSKATGPAAHAQQSAAAASTKATAAPASLADVLPFTAGLATNRRQQPDPKSDQLARLIDEAIAAQHEPPPPPPPPAAAPQPKQQPNGTSAVAPGASVGESRSYASAAAAYNKRSSASSALHKPSAAVLETGRAAVPAAAASASRPTTTTTTTTATATSSMFNWNRPVVITSAPPPPLTAAQLRAQQAQQQQQKQQAPTLHTSPPAAGATAAAPVAGPPGQARRGPSSGVVPIPVPIPEPARAGGDASVNVAPPQNTAGPSPAEAAAAAAATAQPLRNPPSSFLGFNPALAQVLGRAYNAAAGPATTATQAADAASAASAGAAACAPDGSGPGSTSSAAGPRSFQLYDTAGLDAARCIRCRGGMREVVYLHKKNTVAHRAFCRACSAADGRAVGEPCPLCAQPVERVLSMF